MTRSIRFMPAYVQYFTLPIAYCVHTLYFQQATCVLYTHYIIMFHLSLHSVKPVQSVSG